MKITNATSDIKLTHPFKDMLPDVDEFFTTSTGNVQSIGSMCNKIKDLADKYRSKIDPEIFKGYALELFAEYLCKTNGSDNRVGIYKYIPVIGADDNGVDGRGIGENQNPATVQVKYRTGNYILTSNEDKLTNFTNASVFKYGVDIEDNKNMLLITTALKVSEETMENMLYNKVRVLNREALREMFDNRPEWWTSFYESVKASRISEGEKIKPIVLRDHQKEAVNAIMACAYDKGKIILPTGCGKTLVEAEVIRQTIVKLQSQNTLPIIKINSSRILLCFQLFEEVFKYLLSYGITAKYANYNSGNQSELFYINELRKTGGAYRNIISTTSPTEVRGAFQQALKEKVPFIIFSTYHSSEKFADSGLIPHLTIHDEAHNLVSNEFNKAACLPSLKDYYFTATEKVTDSDLDLGMNNESIFGKMIYTKCPRSMIERGEMVMPKIHLVKTKQGLTVDLNKLDKDYDALVKSISSAFYAHEDCIKKWSSTPDELGAKILVVCRGQKDLIEMFKTNVFDKFRKDNPEIHIYAMSSEFGLYMDGNYFETATNAKKFEFLKEVKELKSSDKAIIFHVDMIGEGIDVPGLTGVIPFRNNELCKFYQNVGRAGRLHPVDRLKVYNKEITTMDYSKWIKPSCWIIVPQFLENSDGFADRFRKMIETLRNEYGFIPRQDTLIDNVSGIDDDVIIDTVNNKIKNRPHLNSGLTDFEHEFEQMTISERILFNDDVQQAYEKASVELDVLINL